MLTDIVNSRKTYTLSWADHKLELGNKTCIMGIVNVTPDSFSDGGKFFACDAAVALAEKLTADGADIIDIGGESTRPFSDPVPEDEEIRRVLPVIEKLAQRISVPVSIDTTKAGVARRALEAGASLINDISALRFDPDMAGVAVQYGTPLVLMHMLGNPKSMQVTPTYDDLIADIRGFLEDAVCRAQKEGISKSKLIIDPGIGFGKTVSHNLLLLKRLHAFQSIDVPILIGSSRKSFLRKILKGDQVGDIPADRPVVETATQAAVAAAVLNGAHMVRVHDVAATRATTKILDAVCNIR